MRLSFSLLAITLVPAPEGAVIAFALAVRLPLFRFDTLFLSLELFPLLDLDIAWNLLEPTW